MNEVWPLFEISIKTNQIISRQVGQSIISNSLCNNNDVIISNSLCNNSDVIISNSLCNNNDVGSTLLTSWILDSCTLNKIIRFFTRNKYIFWNVLRITFLISKRSNSKWFYGGILRYEIEVFGLSIVSCSIGCFLPSHIFWFCCKSFTLPWFLLSFSKTYNALPRSVFVQ